MRIFKRRKTLDKASRELRKAIRKSKINPYKGLTIKQILSKVRQNGD